jgi:alcohol dehydrogenase (NADP+)
MMREVKAYAIVKVNEPLEAITIERRDLGPKDVMIEVEYCGICHTEVHFADGEFPAPEYPLVPGHEIAGVVTEVGPEVTRHAIGDRVGIGCMVNSCGTCAACVIGEEQYCLAGTIIVYQSPDVDGRMTQGGFSSHIPCHEDFVVKIPDSLDSKAAGPLLCGGITVYSPLRHWNVGPGTKVAIVGLGGLGHYGVKMAVELGAEVTVLSQSLKKREDALRMGAKELYATSDPETWTTLANEFDFILNTVSATVDVDAYLRLLALDGHMVSVGAPMAPMPVNVWSLMNNRRSYSGSQIGSIKETQEMLDFCAERGIEGEIEVISVDYINTSFERIVNSDVRYRFVVDMSTL